MRIAVASQGTELSSRVDPRFGRAVCFVVHDTENGTTETIANDQNVNAAQGAGIQAAEQVIRKRVELVIAGNFGPKAFQALRSSGIQVATWADGTVSEAIALVQENKIQLCENPSVKGHWM